VPSEQEADAVLAELAPYEHVEFFAELIFGESGTSMYDLVRRGPRSDARVGAKTMVRWIGSTANGKLQSLDARRRPEATAKSSAATPPQELAITLRYQHEDALKLFMQPNTDVTWMFETGVAAQIKRLPPNPSVPLPTEGLRSVTAGSIPSPLTDWESAEVAARDHLIGLGFHGARCTNSGSDRGIDVFDPHHNVVAQVKMHASPVGSPVVQQLRGASPDAAVHIVYSTGGFTESAKTVAADANVALFLLTHDGACVPGNAAAVDLMGTSSERSGSEVNQMFGYAYDVQGRVDAARTVLGPLTSEWHQLPYGRCDSYVRQAELNLLAFWNGSAAGRPATFLYHSELLAASPFWHAGLPYPTGTALPKPAAQRGLDDYY
jgi:hypothetical protein